MDNWEVLKLLNLDCPGQKTSKSKIKTYNADRFTYFRKKIEHKLRFQNQIDSNVPEDATYCVVKTEFYSRTNFD